MSVCVWMLQLYCHTDSFYFTFVGFSFDSFCFFFLLMFTSKQLLTPQCRQMFKRRPFLPYFCLMARFSGYITHAIPTPLMHLWKALYINMHAIPTNSLCTKLRFKRKAFLVRLSISIQVNPSKPNLQTLMLIVFFFVVIVSSCGLFSDVFDLIMSIQYAIYARSEHWFFVNLFQ